MPAPATLLVFALAASVLVAIPGPNHIYVVVLTIATTTDVLYALAAGTLGGWLRSRPAFVRVQRYVTGCIYLGLAAAATFVPGERRRT
jgi:threonine/homoserine/homoserine lactone efflux protein